LKKSDLLQFRDSNSGRINLNQIPDLVLEDNIRGRRFKKWIILEEGRVLFKESDPNTYEDYSQMFYSEFAGACGVDAAEYDLAVFERRSGIITPDFAPGKKLISGENFLKGANDICRENNDSRVLQNNVEDICYALALYHYNPASIFTVSEALIKKIVLDGILLETDCNPTNWSMVAESSATLTPFYDCSTVCCLGKRKSTIHSLVGNLKDYSALEDIIKACKINLHISHKFIDSSFQEEFEYLCRDHYWEIYDVFERALAVDVEAIIMRIEEKTKVPFPYNCSVLLRFLIKYNLEILNSIYVRYAKERKNNPKNEDDMKIYHFNRLKI